MKHATSRTRAMGGLVIACLLGATGCTKHTVQVEPIEVKPITAHVTVDMNIRMEIDRELDDFFEDIEAPGAETKGGS